MLGCQLWSSNAHTQKPSHGIDIWLAKAKVAKKSSFFMSPVLVQLPEDLRTLLQLLVVALKLGLCGGQRCGRGARQQHCSSSRACGLPLHCTRSSSSCRIKMPITRRG